MGERFQFICRNCGYKALVSGREDCGYGCTTVTVACEKCGELYDIATEYFDEPEKNPPVRRCPRRAAHQIHAWVAGDPCPHCGGAMHKGILVELWD